VRIFGGSLPWKISQEIQPDWTGRTNPDGTPIPNTGINFASALGLWAVNDPVARVIYFGLPIGNATAPSLIYPMNYRNLDTPEQIYGDAPIKVGFGGRLICTDNTRKWTRWNLPMNGAALMFRGAGALSLVLFCGNGKTLGTAQGFGQVYTLSSTKLTDDDYGLIASYYILAPLPDASAETGLQLGPGRKLLAYLTSYIPGTGTMTISAFIDQLANQWVNQCIRTLQGAPKRDLEWSGGMVQGQRIFIKFASSPINPAVSLDNGFALQRVNAVMKKCARLPVTGSVG
jgi:hypothetical protein